MTYEAKYTSPLGAMVMRSDGRYLTRLFFSESNDAAKCAGQAVEKSLPIFDRTARWLDIYFGGEHPGFTPEYRMEGLTPFRRQVVELMVRIPYGQTTTYNALAQQIAAANGMRKMSAQAVGGAVGWNPVCLVVPCHRVVGARGNLTGYGSGIENKVKLLELEGHDMSRFHLPTKRR